MQNEIECLEMNSLIEYFSYLNYTHQNNKVSHEMKYNIGDTYQKSSIAEIVKIKKNDGREVAPDRPYS